MQLIEFIPERHLFIEALTDLAAAHDPDSSSMGDLAAHADLEQTVCAQVSDMLCRELREGVCLVPGAAVSHCCNRRAQGGEAGGGHTPNAQVYHLVLEVPACRHCVLLLLSVRACVLSVRVWCQCVRAAAAVSACVLSVRARVLSVRGRVLSVRACCCHVGCCWGDAYCELQHLQPVVGHVAQDAI